MLRSAGIRSAAQLQRLGSVRAFVQVQAAGLRPSLNLLWALEGALTGLPWQQVARFERTRLLLDPASGAHATVLGRGPSMLLAFTQASGAARR